MPIVADWSQRLFQMPIPIGEKVVRTVAVYLMIVILLRLFGRRTVAQLNAFDLVVLLLLSNVVQNAIIGPDQTLLGGAIGVAALLGVNAVTLRAVRRSRMLDRLFEGEPVELVRDGVVDGRELRRLGIRQVDLESALLEHGAESLADVHTADMSPSGVIALELKDDARNATRVDVEHLAAKLDRLQAAVDRLG